MPPELVPPALETVVLEPAPAVVFLCLTVPPPPPALGDPAEGDRPPDPTLVALAAGPG